MEPETGGGCKLGRYREPVMSFVPLAAGKNQSYVPATDFIRLGLHLCHRNIPEGKWKERKIIHHVFMKPDSPLLLTDQDLVM